MSVIATKLTPRQRLAAERRAPEVDADVELFTIRQVGELHPALKVRLRAWIFRAGHFRLDEGPVVAMADKADFLTFL